jgi:hypothetical protein
MPARPLVQDDADWVAAFLSEWSVPVDVAQLRVDWERDGFDLKRDSWVEISSDGSPVAVAWSYPGGWAVAAANTDAAYREVVSKLLERAAAGVVRLLERAEDAGTVGVLLEEGFEAAGEFTQWRIKLDALSVDTPSGIRVERAEGEADPRQMFRLIARAYGDHTDFEEWRAWIMTWEHDPRLWLVVRGADSIEGALVGWTFPGEGYIKRVAVSESSSDQVATAVALIASAQAVFRSDAIAATVALPVGSGDPPYVAEAAARLGMRPEDRVTLVERHGTL